MMIVGRLARGGRVRILAFIKQIQAPHQARILGIKKRTIVKYEGVTADKYSDHFFRSDYSAEGAYKIFQSHKKFVT